MKSRVVKSFILLLVGLFSLSAEAKLMSVDEAIEYANKTSITQFKQSKMMSPMSINSKKEVTYNLRHTVKTSGRPTVYVVDKSNGGFMLLAANNDVGNGLLGYVDSGSFNPDSSPDGLQYMLEAFNDAVYYADILEDKQDKEYSYQKKPAIAPLIVSKWAQTNKFKSYCPDVNGENCYVGCCGVAIGQILNYHRYPESGQGSISYKAARLNRTIEYNFEENPFKWENINPNISGPGTEAMWDAVAHLLYASGVACKSNYSTSGTSATLSNVQTAFCNIFGYSYQCQNISRSWYTNKEWEDIVYNELFNGRPVLYSGTSETDGGHAFICDGYNNGYFHINWGWWGSGDGYFLLSALDPDHQSIGFARKESILIGLEPKLENPSYTPTLVVSGDLRFNRESAPLSNGGELQIKGTTGIFNQSLYKVEGSFGLKMTNVETSEVLYLQAKKPSSINPNNLVVSFYIDIENFPNEGTWISTPSFIQDSDSTWYDVNVVKTKEWAYVTESRNDSIFFYTQSDAIANDIIDITQIVALTVPPTTNYFSPMDVELIVDNPTMYRTTKVYTPVLLNNDTIVSRGSMQLVDIEPDESEKVVWKSYWDSEMPSGNYQIALMDKKGKLSKNRVDIQVEDIGRMSTAAAKIIIYDLSSVHYVEIYDVNGMIVAKGENLKRSLKPGMYVIQYTLSDGTREIKKIFIN